MQFKSIEGRRICLAAWSLEQGFNEATVYRWLVNVNEHGGDFSTVVFTAAELSYWVPTAPTAVPGDFFPTLVVLESQWEAHSVLLRLPTSTLVLSARETGWEVSLEKALREIQLDLAADIPANITARASLRAWVGTKSPASGIFVLPPAAAFNHFSHLVRHDFARRPAMTAAATVDGAGVRAAHLPTVGSSLAAPVRVAPTRAGTAASTPAAPAGPAAAAAAAAAP